MSDKLSIGNEIKDSFQETQKWVQNNIKWLKDIELFYRERSKLEREYSEKLGNLTKEFLNKKSGSAVSLSVGDTPKVTPGSLEAAGVVAWNEVISQTEMISKDHNKLAQDFDGQVADQLSGLYAKLDMTLTKIGGFNNEMVDKRDNIYHELEKAKKKYDDACVTMEKARSTQTKSSSERNKRKVEEKESEMNIAKNEYLITINQSNRIKDKYYFQDIPEVLDLLQDLNEARTLFLNDLWGVASSVEIDAGNRIAKRLDSANSVILQNKPSLSTAMFIKHNLKQWKEPNDFRFQPSPVWHDDEKFVVPTQAELTDLKIKLAQAEKEYNRLQDLTHSELSKLSSLNKRKQELKSNEAKMDGQAFYETLKTYLSIITPFTGHETLKLKAEVQIESIQNNVPSDIDLSTDDIDLSRVKKKSGLFSKIKHNLLNPETKGMKANHRIGLFGNGSNSSEKRASSIQSIDNDTNSISTAGSGPSSFMTTTTSDHNKVLFPYSKKDDDEVSINVGDSIALESSDTGSGWTKIRNNTTGGVGLVPTTYVEINEKNAVEEKPPAPQVPPPRRTTLPTRTLQAQYDYEAQGDDEISISVNDVIEVIKGDDGSGWTYGQIHGQKGLFPTSYCR